MGWGGFSPFLEEEIKVQIDHAWEFMLSRWESLDSKPISSEFKEMGVSTQPATSA